MTEQLIADILAIKHRQDLTAQAAVREKAEKAQAEEEFKKLVAKRWASTKTQLLDAASTLNQAFKPGGIEVNWRTARLAHRFWMPCTFVLRAMVVKQDAPL